MAVLLEESALAEIFTQLASYRKITDYFGLNDEQAKSKNTGDWIIDTVRQYQTSFQIAKTMGRMKNENQKVENYTKETRLPLENPLLGKTDAGGEK